MTEPKAILDQDDVLATNERLRAENTRLSGELAAAMELLDTSQGLAARATAAETAARVSGEEVIRLKADNAQLVATQADFDRAVATQIQKLGLWPNAAPHQTTPDERKLTATERVLLAKGVNSLAELRAAVK